jgi:hypothetical protein
MKFLKIILKVILSIILLIAISVAGYFAWKTYNFYFWTPPEKLDGIHLGMSRSDILFTQGSDVEYHPKENYQTSKRLGLIKKRFQNTSVENKYVSSLVYFDEDDKVEKIILPSLDIAADINIPFKNTEDLIAAFGEPDILAIKEDDTERRYTYVKKEISFGYKHNELIAMTIGEITWRSFAVPKQKYYIYGKQICPSEQCPWNEDVVLKEDFKGRNYTYFLKDK